MGGGEKEKQGEKEEEGDMEEENRKRRRKRGGGCRYAWGVPMHACGLQQHQHKAPNCEGFESWPDSPEKQKRERRVVFSQQDGTAFIDLARFLFLHQTWLSQLFVKGKRWRGGGDIYIYKV